MSITVGANNILDAFNGSVNVDSIYFGDKLVWQKNNGIRLYAYKHSSSSSYVWLVGDQSVNALVLEGYDYRLYKCDILSISGKIGSQDSTFSIKVEDYIDYIDDYDKEDEKQVDDKYLYKYNGAFAGTFLINSEAVVGDGVLASGGSVYKTYVISISGNSVTIGFGGGTLGVFNRDSSKDYYWDGRSQPTLVGG